MQQLLLKANKGTIKFLKLNRNKNVVYNGYGFNEKMGI
jgi:hypothetical protein